MLPILKAVEWLVRMILRGFGMQVGKIQSILSPREELRGAVDLLHRAGGVEKLDRDMMGGLLDLRDLTVSDVMIHRTEMITLDADEPPRGDRRGGARRRRHAGCRCGAARRTTSSASCMQRICCAPSTRPAAIAAKIDIAALARPPWFVPDTTPLSEQLKAFRRAQDAVRARGRRIRRARRAW